MIVRKRPIQKSDEKSTNKSTQSQVEAEAASAVPKVAVSTASMAEKRRRIRSII